MKSRVVLIVSILLALMFLLAGGSKLMELRGPGMHTNDFQSWGYPIWFMYVVGAWEVISGLMLLIPAARFYGAGLLALDMIGAVFTELRASAFTKALIPLILFILVAWIAYRCRPSAARANPVAA